jgi:sulfonate transport system permease protein
MATILPHDDARRPLLTRIGGARWVSPLVLLLLWELGARTGLIPARTLAAPSAVLATMGGMIASGELGHNVLVSLGRAGIGLAIGVLVGGLLAIVAGLSRRGEAAIDSPVQMLRTLPTLALTPLFIVWFGIGETPKIALIARAFGLSRAEIVRHVVLPGALPSLLVGLRYALSISVLILVVAEQINASSGLGYLINNARDFMRTDIIVVCLMVYAALGLGADAAVRLIERRSLAWRPTILEARS